MFPRLLLLILVTFLTAAALLALRQRRLELNHEIVMLHRAMARDQYATWDRAARIADFLEPQRLESLVDRAALDLERLAPAPLPDPDVVFVLQDVEE
ncbi:MAG: hypothetical protein CMJ18_09085 [Phycisphaeraceae bacterium]|nr:hypothetical protein [Phycisphaeraceae bacterium]